MIHKAIIQEFTTKTCRVRQRVSEHRVGFDDKDDDEGVNGGDDDEDDGMRVWESARVGVGLLEVTS